jgi:ketosteroid isomerase-like protein
VSQENVDCTREAWEYFSRTGESALHLMHKDIVWLQRKDVPDSQIYRGHDGVARMTAQWSTSFEQFAGEVEELIDVDDRVVVVTRLHGRVGGADQEVDMTTAYVGRWADGRLAEVHEYPNKAEALKAVGLVG